MRFPCTVCPLFGLHCVSRGDAHESGQDSGCGWLANSRFPQGPAEVSGLCQFLPAFYSQFQPASCPFDRLNLHQDSVQVVQRSGSCVYQTERLLCFSSHTHRPWSFPASQGVTPPSGCPPGRLFVPETLRSDVIRWSHCSKVACHPGVSRTMFLIKQRFWWPSMARDIRCFFLACSVCAVSKTSNRPSAGLLQPLSVPSRPWSHISLDFVTGLPASSGNTVVLTVVDRFSKAAHFIPLPKLPSARETAVAVIDHVFRIHGLPTDVVSDRGPQFVSKFWSEFCRLLGATVSLSSGYHPQSNGQTERAN